MSKQELSVLGKVCLVQQEADLGDEETFSNTTHHEEDAGFAGYATSYLLLTDDDTLYRVTPDGKIQKGYISHWADVEVTG